MADRNLTAAQLAANGRQSINFAELLYIRTLDTVSSTYDHTFLTNASHDIEVTAAQATAMSLPEAARTTFLAVGPFLQFGTIEESADFQITQMTVSLGGMRGEDLALFLNNLYIDQPLTIWRVWFDGDGAPIGDPVQIFSGRIDRPVITDDPDGAVTIGCQASSQWVDYQRTAGRRTNDAEQQHFFAGDRGFEFAADAIKDLRWGG